MAKKNSEDNKLSCKSLYLFGAIFTLGILRELLLGSGAVFSDPVSFLSAVLYWGSGAALLVIAFKIFSAGNNYETPRKSTTIVESDKALQDEVLHSLGLMTAGIAHNFRNYLEVFEATASMLQRYNEGNEKIDKALLLQQKCLKQANSTVQQLMWFVKRGKQQDSSPRELNYILEDAVQLAELLVKEKGIQIKRDFEAVTHTPNINDISLMQSVINLIKNAAESSKSGSTIIISSRFIAHKESYQFQISVKDSGSGIPDAFKQDLFKPLKSGKIEGTGLGLYTVRQLVEKDGGSVSVESEEGQGTEFKLSYPILH